MKTLDEVIKAYEYCIDNNYRDCRGCPYGCEDGESGCTDAEEKKDTLHYLKELRHILDNTVWVESTKEENGYWKLPMLPETGNDPLTWDELKSMVGKPVWIDSVPLVRRWVIIKKFHPIGGNNNLFDMEVEDGAHFLRKSMGRDVGAWWQAYRKERKCQ